jgi:peroxiredoxin
MVSLIGMEMPSVVLPATDKRSYALDNTLSRIVLFFYPYTGKPGYPDPAGWDEIPGAHGSTPQALAFSDACKEFTKLDVKIFGVSFQATDWQLDFVVGHELRFPLLSDSERRLSTELKLETFRAGDDDYLVRRTIVVSDGVITHDFYPVPYPAQNAVDVLKALRP